MARKGAGLDMDTDTDVRKEMDTEDAKRTIRLLREVGNVGVVAGAVDSKEFLAAYGAVLAKDIRLAVQELVRYENGKFHGY